MIKRSAFSYRLSALYNSVLLIAESWRLKAFTKKPGKYSHQVLII